MNDQQKELDRARSARWFFREQIRELNDQRTEPISPLDRGRIVEALLRLYDRTSWLEDQVRQLQGEPPIGMEAPAEPSHA